MKFKLVLENGLVFEGTTFGFSGTKIGELFFTTSMVGYQDLLSDPAYFGKIACMSYPLIGNYGLADEDYDYKNIFINGYVVKENNDFPSNFRSTRTLSEAMEENKVVGIEGVDTREIVKIIRDQGTMKAMITSFDKPLDECLLELKNFNEVTNPAEIVSCKKIWYSRTANPQNNVVIIDLGVKTSFVKKLNEKGLNVIVVPYNIKFDEIKKLKPNGIIISNGPGNPNNQKEVIALLDKIKGKYPILGIGLGAQVVSLTYGCNCYKLKHGNNGANFPVKNLITNKIDITSQNYFYKIDVDNNTNLNITHQNIGRNDIVGFEDKENKVIGVQFIIQDTLDENENILTKFINFMNK